MKVAPGIVVQNQQQVAGIRKGELNPTLLSILQQLAKELNVGIEVRSGGQAVEAGMESYFTQNQILKYKEFERTGSNRHDAGMAADVVVYAPGIGTLRDGILNDNYPAKNSEELKLLQKFVALGKSKGLKGFGSGPGYMDGRDGILSTFHVDLVGDKFPKTTVMWGKDHSSGNAPNWMKDAYNNPQKFMKIEVKGSNHTTDTIKSNSSAEMYEGHVRSDIPKRGADGKDIKASYRYKNPGAAYPDTYSKMFGATEFGRIGGNHPIAKFDTFEQGIASNLYKFFTSTKHYLGHSFKEAFSNWSGKPRNAPFYYKNVKYKGQLITDGTIVQREMLFDNQFTKDLWLQVLKIEAAGDTQYLQEMVNAFPGAQKLATDMAKGNPVSFPDPTPPIGGPGTQPTSFQQSFSSGQGVGGFLGGLLGSTIGSGAISTGNIASAISGALPPALAGLPSASTFSTGLAESIQTGQGFTPFTSAVQSIASAETPVGRLSAIGDVATQYEAEIKALYPDLAGIDFKSVVPAIVGISKEESPTQRLISALKLIEQNDPDRALKVEDLGLPDFIVSALDLTKDSPASAALDIDEEILAQQKPGFEAIIKNTMSTLGPEETIDTRLAMGPSILTAAAIFSDDPSLQQKAIMSLYESLPEDQRPKIEGLEESLPTLLSGSLDEIVKSPVVSGMMGGDIGKIFTGEASVVEQTLTDLGASAISKATGISGDTSQTLLAGGTDDEVKRMRSEIGGMALDKYIETNPTLKSIIQWFTENQDLITLLGTAGAFAGLSSLLGGGMFGGLAAGAGGMVAARMILGKEGYGNLMSTVEAAAAPAFDLLNGIVDATGLGDIPVMGDMLRGVIGVGRGNPLAALSMATGNFAGAAGILAGSTGVSLFDGEVSSAAMIESLMNQFGMGYSQTTQSTSSNSAENKSNQTPGLPKQGVEGNNPNGQPMASLFNPDSYAYRHQISLGPMNHIGAVT